MKPAFEANFDGLVGPTHNYSGLSHGNLASMENRTKRSNPKAAALQGLEKMHLLVRAGFIQGVLPPQERPDFRALHQLGFRGNESKVLEEVFAKAPELLANCSSASSMWAANSATVSPSVDSTDHKLHFTPANLVSKFHRSLEPELTQRVLKRLFHSPRYFKHHAPLPASSTFGDEGAANHTRLCEHYGAPGIQLFTYGRFALRPGKEPLNFPARQTFEASRALSQLHQLSSDQVVFAQQNPKAIDAGVFHNDVISVGNGNVFLVHEEAFLNQRKVLKEIQTKFNAITKSKLHILLVPKKKVSLHHAVKSYLFNSQLVSPKGSEMTLIAPIECQEAPSVRRFLSEVVRSGKSPISKIEYVDIRQSMRNGGGPACLRLRVVLTAEEYQSTHQNAFMSEKLYTHLHDWVNKHYRDRLELKDLTDLKFVYETRSALEELTRILDLGSIYPFQSPAMARSEEP